jgi:hypothetical protein
LTGESSLHGLHPGTQSLRKCARAWLARPDRKPPMARDNVCRRSHRHGICYTDKKSPYLLNARIAYKQVSPRLSKRTK